MRTINRSALVIVPKEPYIQWIVSLDPSLQGETEWLREQVSVYLVAEDPEGSEESAPVTDYFSRIFEYELEGWDEDRRLWPKKRSFALFQQWFDVRAQSIVTDLERAPLTWEEL
ncbi:MAG: VacJ [Limnochordia bacterium]|jgi:hypothetical protein